MSLSGELPMSQSCKVATAEGATPPVCDTLTPLEKVTKQRTKLHCYCKSKDLDITSEVSNMSPPKAGGGFADIHVGDRSRPDRRQLWPWLVNFFTYTGVIAKQSETVAVKILRENSTTALEQDRLAKDLRRLRQEIAVWRRLKHPNVQPLMGVLWLKTESIPAMVSRWEAKGNLSSYLDQLSTPSKRVMMLQDILCGLTYLHKENVVHADLKGENVLISSEGKPLLCDFGIAWTSVKISVSFTTRREGQGTCHYMAPELLDEDFPGDTSRYTPASDIWAFGCLASLVFSNTLLYSNKTSVNTLIAALLQKEAFPRPDKMEDSHWALVLSCCSFQVDVRADSNFVRAQLRVLQLLLREDLPSQAAIICEEYRNALKKCNDAAEAEYEADRMKKTPDNVPSTGLPDGVQDKQATETAAEEERVRLANLAEKRRATIVDGWRQASTRLAENLEEHSLRHLL